MIRWYLIKTIIVMLFKATKCYIRHPSGIIIGIRINACMYRVRRHENYTREFLINGRMESKYSLDKKLADAARAVMDNILRKQAEIDELEELMRR